MNRHVGRVLVFTVMAVGSATTASAQNACDRACLRTMLDQYLAAVVKHDPGAAPLVVGFRQTENAINVRPAMACGRRVTGARQGAAAVLRPGHRAGRATTARWRKAARRRSSPCVCASRTASSPKPSGTSRAPNDPGLQRPAPAGPAAGQPAQSRVPDAESAARARRAAQPARRTATTLVPHRRQLLRRDHVARRLGRADAPGLRPRRERHRRRRPARSCRRRRRARRTAGARPRRAARRTPGAGSSDCVAGLAELQPVRWWSARRTPLVDEEAQVVLGLRRVHPPAGIADAAERLQRVVRDRRGEDPHDLHGDVLSAAGARRAELAAVRRQLAAAGDDRAMPAPARAAQLSWSFRRGPGSHAAC